MIAEHQHRLMQAHVDEPERLRGRRILLRSESETVGDDTDAAENVDGRIGDDAEDDCRNCSSGQGGGAEDGRSTASSISWPSGGSLCCSARTDAPGAYPGVFRGRFWDY